MKAYSQKDYVSGRVHLSANYTKSVLPRKYKPFVY